MRNLLSKISTVLVFITYAVVANAQGGADCASATTATLGSNTTSAFASSPGNGTDNAFKWFAFTSTGCGTLSVSSCNGGSDTRLAIFSGACGSQTSLGTNDDTPGCISVGADEYGSDLSVAVSNGATYYIRWGNGWDAAGFTWNISFTPSTNNNIGIQGTSGEYTIIPVRQFSGNVPLNVVVSNTQGVNNTNLSVSCNVIDLQSGSNLQTLNSTPQSLACGENTSLNLGNFAAPIAPGAYMFTFSYGSNEFATDNNSADNADTSYVIISSDLYARSAAYITGNIDGSLGTTGSLANPSENFQGQRFDIRCTDRIDSVNFYMAGGAAGDTIQVQIYNMSMGTPSTVVASSPIFIRGAAAPGDITLALSSPLTVTAGQSYVVGVRHRARGSNTGMAYTDDIFTPGAGWIKVGANGTFANPESLGFPVSYLINPVFPQCLPINVVLTPTNPNCTASNGGISNTTSELSNCATFTYVWSNGATGANLSNLAAGTFSVTVSDNYGCTVTNTQTLTASASTLAVDGTVTNGTTSSITTTLSGNTTGCSATYVWSNGATTANISGLMPGTYNVTATNCYGCTVTNSFVVTGTVGISEITGLTSLAISPNPAQNDLNVMVEFDKSKEITIEMLNAVGQVIYRRSMNNVIRENVNIDLSDFSNGVYQLSIISNNERTSRKVVITK